MFDLSHLKVLRIAEMIKIAPFFPPGARVLEIGAGTGEQAAWLRDLGFHVDAIELADSNYSGVRIGNVIDYDGITIPFSASTYDIVFSSNVLEHVPHLTNIHAEIRRVLKPGGYAIHVLPTHTWRLWTLISAFPESVQRVAQLGGKLVPPLSFRMKHWYSFLKSWYSVFYHLSYPLFRQVRHGERGNVVSEIFFFHPKWWRRNFQNNAFVVEEDLPMGIFYTGNMVLGNGLSIKRRECLSTWLGSSTHIFRCAPRL